MSGQERPRSSGKGLQVLLGAALMIMTLLAAVPAAAQVVPTDTLVENIECLSDPAQTYTLYLPDGYPGERRWPVMLVLDPRGRSLAAARLFEAAAREYGWILVSSDNIRSDGPSEPNLSALNALWPEINTRFAIDQKRIYAAGFSGGAHFSYLLGKQTGALAGVVACGGRPISEWLDESNFPLFGAAGTSDFNYLPMFEVEEMVAAQGNPHRLEIFDGTHEWMPPELARLAVDWMELEAMKAQLRPRDEELIGRLFARDVKAAEELEAAGRHLEAMRRWEAIGRTFEGLHDVARATGRAAELAASREVKKALKEETHEKSFEKTYLQRLFYTCDQLRAADTPIPLPRMLRDLRIASLKKRAARQGVEGATGRRLLATAFSQTAVYLTNDMLLMKRYEHAVVALRVAAEIRSDSRYVLYNLACAEARCRRTDEALEALGKAIENGFADAEHIAADPDLENLRELPAFKEMLARLEAR